MNNNKKLALSIENAGVAYKRRSGFFGREEFWALRNVSFDVYHGETLGVIGRNGVGKSTLLKLLAGIISQDEGMVHNFGVSATLLSLQLGFLSHLTGRENAILSGMMLGLTKREIEGKMKEIADFADIGEFFEQPVMHYSSGMKARLGFSIAINAKSDVILLDEVLGVGDADFKKKSTATMREVIKSDRTVVLVSHNIKLINSVCDRVVWLDNHEVKMVDCADEVVAKYR
jgi:lipopolysaccharide transport system ATP-binding protein